MTGNQKTGRWEVFFEPAPTAGLVAKAFPFRADRGKHVYHCSCLQRARTEACFDGCKGTNQSQNHLNYACIDQFATFGPGTPTHELVQSSCSQSSDLLG